MKNKAYILIILLICTILAGCDNHTKDTPAPEELQMQDGEFEGLGEGRSGMTTLTSRGMLTAIGMAIEASMEAIVWVATPLQISLFSDR